MFRDPRDPSVVNLILKSGVEGRLPPEMAWVFPLPSKPLEYREADPSIFSELSDFARTMEMTRGPVLGAEQKRAITVHEKAVVGDYELVPIEITDPSSAATELDKWLREQGYNELPAGIQKPYLRQGAVFLAVKVVPKGDSMELKPLWIRYRAESMSFPLRFTHDHRSFDSNLYFVHSPSERVSGAPSYHTSSPLLDSVLATLTNSELIRPDVFNPYEKIDIKLSALRSTPRGSFRELKRLLEGQPATSTMTRLAIRGINTEFSTSGLDQDPGVIAYDPTANR